jgi:hypothetical protein
MMDSLVAASIQANAPVESLVSFMGKVLSLPSLGHPVVCASKVARVWVHSPTLVGWDLAAREIR